MTKKQHQYNYNTAFLWRKKMAELAPEWDLKSLYASPKADAFKKDLKMAALLSKRLRSFCKDKVADLTPKEYGKMLITYDRMYAKLQKRSSYASIRYMNETNDDNAAFAEKTDKENLVVFDDVYFFEKETANLSDEKVAEMLTDPTVRRFATWIDGLRLNKEPDCDEKTGETLRKNSVKKEKALYLYDEVRENIPFKLSGKAISNGDLYALAYSPDAEKRRKAGEALNNGYKSKSASFAKIVTTIAQTKKYRDEYLGYKTPVEARNRSNQIENSVVDALVSSVDQAAPDVAHRYYALKAKWLGQEKIGYWDRNAPVAGIKQRRYSFEEAKNIILSAYKEFDPEIGDIAQKYFDENRVDARPRPSKQAGEYAERIVDGKSFVSVNFNGTMNDVMALAHELGHGIHFELEKKNGALQAETPVTINETASIFGEMLTFDYMMKQEKNPRQRFALMSDKMTRVMLTTFRQVAMHHYEEGIHNAVREKDKLSAKDINAIWTKAQSDSMGPAVINDERSSSTWADVPHLLRTPFYVYGYAFGECLTTSLYQVYKDGSVKDFPKKYKEMLSKGATERCSDLLKPFGLDISKPDFWKQGLTLMKKNVDTLEALTDTLGMDKTKKNANTVASTVLKTQKSGR